MSPMPKISTDVSPRHLLMVKYGAKYEDNPELGKVLTTPAADVTEFDDRLRQLVIDMFHTMYRMNGIGLAAPQIGLGIRLAVIDVSFGARREDQIVMVNPKILDMHGNQKHSEGCLSIPGFNAQVERGKVCYIEAQDESGERYQTVGDGLLARVIQHEIDHLDGKVYLDRLSVLRRSMITVKIRKMHRRGQW